MNDFSFSSHLIDWYLKHQRDLPWRNTSDPYPIWLSEIILQQTRVEQGLPYYMAFTEKYPSIKDLAVAPEEEVLRLWQGLGYYSRARNLHAAAKQVVNEFDGQFPNTYEQILTLKGVGPYTAAAIASFAFHEDVAVVDGNVYRVLARYFGIKEDISDTSSKKTFQKIADSVLTKGQSYLHNQAIMEFGSQQCKPGMPSCESCVLNDSCYSFEHGCQNELPVKSKKVKAKKVYFNYLVIEVDGTFLLKQRGAKNIWQGLYDFTLIESEKLLSLDALFDHEVIQNLSLKNPVLEKESKPYKHILTHREIHAKFWHIKTDGGNPNANFYNHEEIKQLPKPILINNYLNEHIF